MINPLDDMALPETLAKPQPGHFRAVWYHGNATITIEDGPMMAADAANFDNPVVMRGLFSGISRGTERLVFTGKVPASEHQRMRCPHQDGVFGGPVKYGYAMIAECIDGPLEMQGRPGFVLHPHQTGFTVPADDVHLLPEALPPKRACLIANMETALNILWDSHASAGDRILVVGGGVLGLLVTALAAGLPGAGVTLCDPVAERATLADLFGAAFCTPDQAPDGQDVVIHVSGNPAGLETAFNVAGYEARVVEASWYGDRPVSVPLGGAFHSQRLSLISSQVGGIPADRRGRWTYRRRLATAMQLLCDDRFDHLITGEIAFDDVAAAMPSVFANDADGLMTVIRYP